MSKANGGPAFPISNCSDLDGYVYAPEAQGMTLRDYAIVHMMAAWRASEVGVAFENMRSAGETAALAAADVDAMLKAREGK